MKDYKEILRGKEESLKKVNRLIFGLRVKQRRTGFNEQDRINYRRLRMLRITLKNQVKGLTNKL